MIENKEESWLQELVNYNISDNPNYWVIYSLISYSKQCIRNTWTTYYVRYQIMDWWRDRGPNWIVVETRTPVQQKTHGLFQLRSLSKNTSSYTLVIITRKECSCYCKTGIREIDQFEKLLWGIKYIDGEFKKCGAGADQFD